MSMNFMLPIVSLLGSLVSGEQSGEQFRPPIELDGNFKANSFPLDDDDWATRVGRFN